MGQHLVNLKCMYPTQSEADVFYSTRIIWAILPLFIPFCATVIWLVLSRLKHIVRFHSKMKATVVALLFLMWPGLCSETFAMFSCRDVCEETLLRVDLDETCWEGRHAGFAYFLGVPMLIGYVIGLPTIALVGVWRVQKRAADRGAKIETLDGHLTFGLFYSACKCVGVFCSWLVRLCLTGLFFYSFLAASCCFNRRPQSMVVGKHGRGA
jgi:hypothetical protein